MKRSGVADMSHRIAGHRYVARVRRALIGGVTGLGVIARRLSFPGDSIVLLALLLATNLLRIYVPGLVADGVFGVTVLLLALSLFREPFPASARTTALCFAALLTVYAVGLLVEFSIQGASNFAGILFASVIFLFCWRNAPTLIRARYVIPLLLTAALALFPLYLLPVGLNSHTLSSILGYLLLIIGLILITRSDNRKNQHQWTHAMFLLVTAIALVFGNRSFVLIMLLAHPLYWSGYFFLRNRLRTGALVATVGLLIGAPIVLLGTSFSDAVETTFGDFVKEHTGSGLLSGREVLWRYSLAAISESPWLGHGPGTVITRLTGDLPVGKAGDSPPSPRPSDREPSCLDHSNPGLLRDCAALLEMRKTLTGENLIDGSAALGSWVPSRLLHHWQGVKLAGYPPRVVALDLPKRGLAGVVPPELGRLDKLELLRLSNNALTGPIPSELGRLSNLRVLALDDNALSGPVPPQLGALENLEELWLRGNRLSGEVPLELANLTNLSLLHLAGNDFTGTVPAVLHDTADHDLDRDLFCLPLPRLSKGLLADCETLLAARDALAGNAALDWKRARPIAAWQGVAVGEAPGGIRVVGLDLTGLGLSGRLPPALGTLDGLVSLRLGDNRLTGSIPPELGKLAHLRELQLANNRLSGSIPPELGRPFGLSILRLAGNDLAGGLPPTLDHVGEHDWGLDLFCLPAGKAGFPSPGIGNGLLEDCTALLEARDVLAGDATLNWKRSRPIGAWQGVKVGGAPARVIGLDLPKKDLRGTIPPELGRLSNLRVLALDDNALNGPVPPQLGALENLEELWLHGNRLSNEVPPELGRLRNLRVLRLAGNDFSGAVPQGLYEVADHDLARDLLCLPGLGIDGGLLSDCNTLLAVRDALAGDTALDWKRSRPISAWPGVTIGEAAGDARVVELDLTGLGLSGRIPPALDGLDQLMSLRLAGNRLTGSIPPQLGKLAYLKELWLNGNELSGDIPSELAMLGNLSSLRLAGNDFTGAATSALRHVAAHDLDRNRHCRRAAPRSNPGLVHDCAVLLTARDVLAGEATLGWRDEIPIEFWEGVVLDGAPARVVELNLPSMALTGIVPPVLSELDRLVALRLVGNRLTGAIPPGLGRLTHLRELVLGSNALSGPIPPQLGDLEQLTVLHLYENRLSGPIPPELGKLRSLRGLSLASNRLTGPIPVEVGRLANLKWLNLQFNRLSGSILPTLRRLEKLESIKLSHNDFVDAAPEDSRRDNVDPESDAPAPAGRHDPGPSGPTSLQSNPGLLADRAILLTARDVLAGAASLNWDDSIPLEYWEGVVLDGSPARVTGLTLREKGLSGRIPPALSELDRLAVLRLHRNRLTGAIPPELGRLTHLRELVLGSNALSGPIPPQLGDLEQLTVLHLYENRLSGPIPPELGKLRSLRGLSLASNRLTGPIPVEVGRLANLKWLNLQFNRLSGSILPTLRRLEKLESIKLSHNDFVDAAPEDSRRDNVDPESDAPAPAGRHDPGPSGPTSLQSNPGLLADRAILLTARDVLAGAASLNWDDSIPLEYWEGVVLDGSPARVTGLTLREKGLSGRIPPALSELDRLAVLRLHRNRLTGAIPPELGRLTHLRELVLGSNALSGPIPPQLGDLEQLTVLHLYENRLSGPIPPELGKLRSLRGLSLASNRLTGPIPVEVGRLANLKWLNLQFNRLSGSILPTLRRLEKLESIKLSHNDFVDAAPEDSRRDNVDPESDAPAPAGRHDPGPSGPTSLQSNPGLLADRAILLTARDVLAGAASLNWDDSIPLEYWEGVVLDGSPLRELALGFNALSGTIPPQLGDLEQLTLLHLHRNRLTGPIPQELARLTSLRTLTLDSNALSGEVPPQLAKLPNLGELWLDGNQLDLPLELATFNESPTLGPNGSSAAITTAQRVDPDLFCPSEGMDGGLPVQADNLAGDCTALLAAEELLDGDGGLNWSRATPVNAWQGVAVGGEPPRVFALDLSGAGLTGAIPPELGQLQSLVWLHLSDNALTGPIPSELGRLSKLRVLALDDNALSGAIPSELGSLVNLEEMSLQANRLTGPIPPELESLTRLSALRLGGNQFSGCIPFALHDLADRELELDLLCDPWHANQRGLREDAIALMEMRDILAGSARLNWSYATPISAWEGVTVSPVRPAGRGARGGAAAQETKRVVGLDLSGMGLDGRLPAALAELDQLIWLRLNDNRLTGPIPPELGQFADLRELGLEANVLTGPVPPELGQLANLSELWLGDNHLTDAIPPELAALDALSVLHLRGNQFSGCLPPLGQSSGQPRARPDGLPGCGAAPDPGFSTLGDVIKRINAAVDPSTPGGIPRSAHNLYLQVGMQTGVFGLGALALLCASLIFNLRVRTGVQVTLVHCYAAACTIVVLVHNTFEVYLLQNVFVVGCVEWILIGLAAGVVNHLPVRCSAQAGDESAGGGLTDGA